MKLKQINFKDQLIQLPSPNKMGSHLRQITNSSSTKVIDNSVPILPLINQFKLTKNIIKQPKTMIKSQIQKEKSTFITLNDSKQEIINSAVHLKTEPTKRESENFKQNFSNKIEQREKKSIFFYISCKIFQHLQQLISKIQNKNRQQAIVQKFMYSKNAFIKKCFIGNDKLIKHESAQDIENYFNQIVEKLEGKQKKKAVNLLLKQLHDLDEELDNINILKQLDKIEQLSFNIVKEHDQVEYLAFRLKPSFQKYNLKEVTHVVADGMSLSKFAERLEKYERLNGSFNHISKENRLLNTKLETEINQLKQ